MRYLHTHCCIFLLLLIMQACKKDNNNTVSTPLSISSFYPSSGKGRTLVTIVGKGFQKDYQQNKVLFNGVAADILSVTDTSLIASAPDNGTSGVISVSTGDKKLDAGTFTYQDLSITASSPTRAAAYDIITIKGYGFKSNSDMPRVMIGDFAAKIIFVSDSSLQVAIPEEANGKGALRVIIGDKSVSSSQISIVKALSFSPKAGFGGSDITITGSGFNTTLNGNRVFYNTIEYVWGWDGPVWRRKEVKVTDTLQIISATEEKLVARIPQTVKVNFGSIEMETDGINKILKTEPAPTFYFLREPVINLSMVSGGVRIYVFGSDLLTRIPGLSTRVYIGSTEIEPKYIAGVSESQITIEPLPPGLKSGILKVEANGKTVAGDLVELP